MFVELLSLIKPTWLKMKIPSGENYVKVKKTIHNFNLHTVCEEASCPNVSECWSSGTATIMIMGDVCSRACKFCDVTSGKPSSLDSEEPFRVAEAIKEWNLRYVVITSVCRDDLDDEGSEHFARTISSIRKLCPTTVIESLIPDFSGNENFITKIIDAKPHVISHNLETVRRLSPNVRDHRANYDQSLRVLKFVKNQNPEIFTKSSLMLGLGENDDEVFQTANDLRRIGVEFFTLGQYLQPSLFHLPVREFIHPEKFNLYKVSLKKLGFLYIASGPFVRSSFRASDVIDLIKNQSSQKY